MSLQIELNPARWIRLESIDSTNSFLLSGTYASGTVVIAKTQTAGRGRMGRSWESMPGSLIFSCILEFDGSLLNESQYSSFSVLAGVSLLRALERLTSASKTTFKLKAPNDVIMIGSADKKKVAGVLVESEIRKESRRVVIGIGVNGTTAPAQSDSVYQPGAVSPNGFDAEYLAGLLIEEMNIRLNQIDHTHAGFLEEAERLWIQDGELNLSMEKARV